MVAYENIKVLVTGRNQRNLDTIGTGLQSIGIRRAIYCRSVGAAVAALRNFTPDALIVALDSSPVDGITFVRILRDFVTDAPILMYGRAPTRTEVVAAGAVGIDDYVCMPVGALAFVHRFKTMIRHSGLGDAPSRAVNTYDIGAPPVASSDWAAWRADKTAREPPLLTEEEIAALFGRG